MVASRHFTRLDTLELKDLIHRKIGKQRADKYFDQLKKFLGLKISKAEFDESCIETIGKENIPIHNRLIGFILQNACLAKVPPPKPGKVEGPGVKVANGYQRTCLQSLYGDGFPQSPRKCRSPISRDNKFRDRPSPLGPLSKNPCVTIEETGSIQEPNATGVLSLNSGPQVEVAMVEDGEEVEQFEGRSASQRWRGFAAPIGLTVNTSSSHKSRCYGSNCGTFVEPCRSTGMLPDTKSLSGCLQEKLSSEGVDISLDCVNLLNRSLDIFLKRLIGPCLGNAVLYPNSQLVFRMREILRENSTQSSLQTTSASLLDFRVAMELNPQLLGPEWSTVLEKIHTPPKD